MIREETQTLPKPSRVEWLSIPHWAVRGRVTLQIARQEFRDSILGWTVYLTATVAIFAAVLLIYNSLRFVDESGLQVIVRPFYYPVLIAATLGALYLAGWATLSIARPRDQGALRVLFFTPVDGPGLLAGHWLAGVGIYAVLMAMTVAVLAALSYLTNLPLPSSLLIGVAVSPLLVSPAVAAGLFLSAISRSSRSALFMFVGALILIAAIEVGYAASLNVPMTSRYYDALSFLRQLLAFTQSLLSWVSPFALLSDGLDASLRSSWSGMFLRVAAGLIGSATWLALGAWAIRRRGVLP